MQCHFCIVIFTIILINHNGNGTIDMNTSHFQYLANHLAAEECRKLVASLHFGSFDLPNPLNQAERKVPKDLTCLEQLLHWNSETAGGHGKAHDIVSRRLKQIDRNDLALWLTNAVFQTFHNEFQRAAVTESFQMHDAILLPFIGPSTDQDEMTTRAIRFVTTSKSHIRVAKQTAPGDADDMLVDPTDWTIFDTISWSIVTILFLLVVVLLIYLALASPCAKRKKRCECLQQTSTQHANANTPTTPTTTTVCPALSTQRSSPTYPMVRHHRRADRPEYHKQPHRQSDANYIAKQEQLYLMSKGECPAAMLKANEGRYHRECHRDCPHARSMSPCQRGECHRGECIASPCQRGDCLSPMKYRDPSDCHCMGPPPPRPICPGGHCSTTKDFEIRPHYNNLARTIDIHQKIAIPMNNLENSN